MQNSETGDNVHIDDTTGLSLTRRSMLGALGASATVGLAGCSGATEQSFTAPWVGMKGETFPLYNKGSRPVTLKNSETASQTETRDAGPLGELKATMNMKATSYNWQLADEYPATVGFVSVPIPKLGGTEFAGPIDDPLNSLVSGKWGLELFNQMGFTDDSVDSVEYGRLNRGQFSHGSLTHPEFANTIDVKIFSVTATMDDESTEEYWMVLDRLRTKAEAVPDGTNDSYVFMGVGTTLENTDSFGYDPNWSLSDMTETVGFIDEPSA